MKNNNPFGELFYCPLKKILLIMRIAIIFLVLGVLQAHATDAYSQKTRLSLNFSNAELVEVLDKIEVESEFFFLYNEKLLDTYRKVDITADNQLISSILDNLFAGTNVKYSIIDRKIILAPNLNIQGGMAYLAQQQAITGTITDSETGQPMPGVNIQVRGTTIGVISDINGRFSLEVPDKNVTLIFSFIGYAIQEIPLDGRSILNVSLISELIGLDEVVVVGYGTQKKINVTGSITQIKTEELLGISTPMIGQSLMGRSPGLFIRNTQGMPGSTSIEMNIRGYGTPLIIVDGTEVSSDYFQQLESESIESINILKDASAAAIYGARAGNGVILVETKKGTIAPPTFHLNARTGLQYFTHAPEFVTSAQYAEMENVARSVSGKDPLWTQEDIKKFRDGTDPDYVTTEWWDEVFRKTSPSYEGSLSIRGGTETVKYFISGSYYYQKGFTESNDITNKRASFLSNLDISGH